MMSEILTLIVTCYIAYYVVKIYEKLEGDR